MTNADWSLQLRPLNKPKDSPESVDTFPFSAVTCACDCLSASAYLEVISGMFAESRAVAAARTV